MIYRILLGLAAAVGGCSAGELSAQTRFPGDSPSRPSYLGGSGGGFSRTTRVVTVGPGWSYGYGGGIVTGYPYSPYYGPYAYGGPPYHYASGYCRVCGGYGSFCRCGPVALPPVAADAGELYGPRALMKFFGAEDDFGLGQPRERGDPPIVAANPPPAGMAPAAPRAAARPVGAGARARAWRFIDHGDRHFKAGRYREALSRYKKAIASEPDLAVGYLRESFAHVGLGNPDRAAVSLRRGLGIDPDWPESNFVLEDLFTADAEREAALRAVAEHLRKHPNDAEARLVAGMLLHFDGEPAAAAEQFRRVVEINGADPAASLFLPEDAEDEAGE